MDIKYVFPMSDLHLEFETYDCNGNIYDEDLYFSIPPLPEHKDTVLCLNGDIGLISKTHTLVPFMEQCSWQFRHVMYVPGNHEFYGSSIIDGVEKLRNLFASLDNVHVLNNDSIEIDGVVFIGSTLWTDFDGNNPISMLAISDAMNDFGVIRTGDSTFPHKRKIRTVDILDEFIKNKQYIIDQTNRNRGKKICVMTHHAPSYMSIHEKFVTSNVNGAYASALDDVVIDSSVKLWFHGHVHDSVDYMIGDTRVVCNPRGYNTMYSNELNVNFDKNLLIEI